MKSIVSSKSCVTIVSYPRLMIGVSTRVVVLMSSRKVGTVVNNVDGFNIGWNSINWDHDTLKPYEGSVCLEND